MSFSLCAEKGHAFGRFQHLREIGVARLKETRCGHRRRPSTAQIPQRSGVLLACGDVL
jgi:hypothetical protein